MEADDIEYLSVGDLGNSRKIALVRDRGDEPGLLWLSGFKSDMSGTKAVELANWARARGNSCTRFDYSGHGLSEGDFSDLSLSDWLEESLAVFDRCCRGRTIVVGSSMGGWLSLLLARELNRRPQRSSASISALVLIAPAVDFSEELIWKCLSPELKNQVIEQGYFLRPSDYSDDPYVITRKFIEDGRRHLLMDKPIETGCPVRILQGTRDESIPLDHVKRVVDLMVQDDVTLTLVKEGDHRLSSPDDIERLKRIVAQMM